MVNYPLSGPTGFEELLEPLPKDIREIARRFRTIIETTLPQADEAVSGGARMAMALYSIDGANNVVCGIQPTENMCKLFFHGWKKLREAGYPLEGSGKHARHIKIRSVRDLDPDSVADMVRIAARHVQAS